MQRHIRNVCCVLEHWSVWQSTGTVFLARGRRMDRENLQRYAIQAVFPLFHQLSSETQNPDRHHEPAWSLNKVEIPPLLSHQWDPAVSVGRYGLQGHQSWLQVENWFCTEGEGSQRLLCGVTRGLWERKQLGLRIPWKERSK